MSLFDYIKKAAKVAGGSIVKVAKSSVAEYQKLQEYIKAKKAILLNLSQEDLKKLAGLCDLDTSGYKTITAEGDIFETKRVKMNRLEYIDYIAKNAPSSKLIYALKLMKKSLQASELEKNLYIIDGKYEQKKREIKEGKAAIKDETNEMLLSILNIIKKSIISFNPASHSKESSYQNELLGYLKGNLPLRLGKTQSVVEREYKFPNGKKLDLFVSTGGYKIGLETKIDLLSSGQVQRLLGQINEYAKLVDALVVVDYRPIQDEDTIQNLKEVKQKSEIPIILIAGGNEI